MSSKHTASCQRFSQADGGQCVNSVVVEGRDVRVVLEDVGLVGSDDDPAVCSYCNCRLAARQAVGERL